MPAGNAVRASGRAFVQKRGLGGLGNEAVADPLDGQLLDRFGAESWKEDRMSQEQG
jgi:hypothetical protein